MYNQERVRRINIVLRYKQCVLKVSVKSELVAWGERLWTAAEQKCQVAQILKDSTSENVLKSIYHTWSRFPSGAAHRRQMKSKLGNISPTRWQRFHPVPSTEPIVSHAPRVMATENSLTTVVQVCGCASVHVFLLHMHVEVLMRAGKLCTFVSTWQHLLFNASMLKICWFPTCVVWSGGTWKLKAASLWCLASLLSSSGDRPMLNDVCADPPVTCFKQWINRG